MLTKTDKSRYHQKISKLSEIKGILMFIDIGSCSVGANETTLQNYICSCIADVACRFSIIKQRPTLNRHPKGQVPSIYIEFDDIYKTNLRINKKSLFTQKTDRKLVSATQYS